MNDLPSLIYKISDDVIEFAKEKLKELPQEALMEHLVPAIGNLIGKMAGTMFAEVANCSDDPKKMYLAMCDILHDQMTDENSFTVEMLQ